MPNNNSTDVIRRHSDHNIGGDKFSLMASAGAASTTKKIVEQSIASRKKMANFENLF